MANQDQNKKRREVIISGSVRNSKTGSQYVMTKTFEIDDVIRKASRYVTFLVFRDKRDDQKRTVILSESDRKFLPKEDLYGDENAVFVSAKVTKASSGVSYIRSNTVDLEDIRSKFGTNYVFVLVTKPQKATSDDQRTVVIKPSSAKFMPGAKTQQTKGGGYRGQADTQPPRDDDEIVI